MQSVTEIPSVCGLYVLVAFPRRWPEAQHYTNIDSRRNRSGCLALHGPVQIISR
jgi:hypothetical protein